MEGTVGEIRLFAGGFAPKNWAYCNGALIQIRSNTALFSILGTTYGGNGSTTFGLPNLAGRAAVGAGQGPGLSNYDLGQSAGAVSVTLNTTQIPPHTHVSSAVISLPAYSDEGNAATPAGNVLASRAGMFSTLAVDTVMKGAPYTVAVSVTGNNVPLPLSQPSLGMNYIICMFGIFPSRS
ncbi:phage tail protein [Flavobacterium hungaricum]|uniref:Phage tail protein n=1 Tax=Flavobacterium hungaricum TaxID=2082725 RepID=A0ABR9TSP7_9FLAO|nr:tail fiber protein [Flavobacterium hungaricum]MBE8728301.1 phage tail protein [Flavobacterium hungaricum]